VMSEAMRDEYARRYGSKGVIMRHGIRREERRPPRSVPDRADRLAIGFAGSFYGMLGWQAFWSALSREDWRVGGREVVIRMLSPSVNLNARGPARVEYLGWARTPSDAIQMLAESDVNYLPCWFEPGYALAARLYFPTKLSAYLAAGRPVLFHGPADSSPTDFLRRFPAGLCCDSLDADRIVESLRRLASDPALYASAVRAGQEALDAELGLDVFLRRFAELVGVGDGVLG
jgi:hypothetical protein